MLCFINTYPAFDSYNPDLKDFCQSMKNQWNAVDCANFIDSKVMPTRDMIDTVDYLKAPKLLLLVSSINKKNQELFTRKDKIVFADLKQACLKHVDFTLSVLDMDYEIGAVMKI